jgi:hypothetical protein
LRKSSMLEPMFFLGLRGIVWVKNADFEPETPLPIRPGKGPTATETLARMA